jgi:hypothetical protein
VSWGCSQCAWSQEAPNALDDSELAALDLRVRMDFDTHNCLDYTAATENRRQLARVSEPLQTRLKA